MAKGKAITIDDYRLSFIWAWTLLTDRAAPSSPFGQRFRYTTLFPETREKKSKDFTLPWPPEKPYAHRFWANYLHVGNPSSVDIQDAWNRATPLRSRQAPFTLFEVPWFTGKDYPKRFCRAEHFFYPFGVTLVVTFEADGPLMDFAWVKRVIDTTRVPFGVKFAGSDERREMNLTAIAGKSLRQAQLKYFPGSTEPQLPTPFSIVTVISGSNVKPEVAPPAGGKIHRMVSGVATRNQNYATAALGKLKIGDNLLKPRGQESEAGDRVTAAGDVVYATSRGRAVWFPSSFTKNATKKDPVSSLSCYHRNQCCAAVQAESLCSLVHEVITRLDNGSNRLPNWINEFGKLPAQILATMYDGDKALTYRSASLPRQIDDNGVKGSITRLRQRHGLPEWPTVQSPQAAPAAKAGP